MTGIFKLHQMIKHFVVAENRVQGIFNLRMKKKHDKQKKKLTNNNNETVCMCHSLLQFS